MPSCPKCGKVKVRKRADGRRKCKRCGVLQSGKFLNRSGRVTPHHLPEHFIGPSPEEFRCIRT
jgi:uncharacterized Zn finger protein (UPF0148 family)